MKLVQEFKKFISRGNVVDMAVGVAVAAAFTKIVTAFTNGFIAPLLALLSNDASLADIKWVVREAVTHTDETGAVIVDRPEVAVLWGSFLQSIIDFLIIALFLFLLMKVFNHAAARAKELQGDLVKELTPDRIKEERAAKAAEEAAAAARAEEEAKAAAEAAAAAAEREKAALAEKEAAAIASRENTERLLAEIRDLLKNKN